MATAGEEILAAGPGQPPPRPPQSHRGATAGRDGAGRGGTRRGRLGTHAAAAAELARGGTGQGRAGQAGKGASTISVKRYLPSRPEQFTRTYTLEFDPDLTVLDALNRIKDQSDGSLTYRYSCRMGICGSCGAMVNGKPVLMCQTYLKDCKAPIRLEPLKNFPIIKDLVVDIKDPFEKMRSTMPYLTTMKRYALEDGEHLQSPAQLEKIKQSSQCIKCMLCYSACPVYGENKSFIGPAASALGYRYHMDSRDEEKDARMDQLSSEKGVWGCSFVGECSTVCPKRVDPAIAVQRLKLMGVLHLAKRLVKKTAQ